MPGTAICAITDHVRQISANGAVGEPNHEVTAITEEGLPTRPLSENFSRVLIHVGNATWQQHLRGEVWRQRWQVSHDRFAAESSGNSISDFTQEEFWPPWRDVGKLWVK